MTGQVVQTLDLRLKFIDGLVTLSDGLVTRLNFDIELLYLILEVFYDLITVVDDNSELTFLLVEIFHRSLQHSLSLGLFLGAGLPHRISQFPLPFFIKMLNVLLVLILQSVFRVELLSQQLVVLLV